MKELSTNCLKIKWRRDIYNRKQEKKKDNGKLLLVVYGVLALIVIYIYVAHGWTSSNFIFTHGASPN